jgi:fatty-acyl-CoA synthase
MQFATLWEHIADACGELPALVQGERRRSWAAFDDRAARLAAAFADLGLGADGKVASYLYNGNEYLEGVFATFKARAVPVNVNYRYTADELLYLLDNSDTEILLFHGSLAEPVAAVRERLPRLRAVVQVDDGSPHLDGALAYEDLITSSTPAPRIERSGDDLYLLYTGGTTGMPKGVMWRNADLFDALMPTLYALTGRPVPADAAGVATTAAAVAEAGASPVHLPASPLMHGTGFFTTLQAATMGGTIVTLTNRHFDPHELWATVQRERVTQTAIVGDAFAKPMVRALEEAEAAGRPYDLSSLQLIVSSGVMWSAEVKQELLRRGAFLCFDSLGSSEGVGFANQVTAPGAEVRTARFSIGEQAKVFTDDGREVTPGSGEVGLLAVGGAIPLGYYKDPDKTAATFREIAGRRWSIPGDYARVAEDGTIELLGRGSVSINTGGEKVFPEEVEEALKAHPAVHDALVVGLPDDRFGEAVTAVVALEPGASATTDELVEAATVHLARYKRPRHVVLVERVVRGPNGKADYAWARRAAAERLTT